MAILRSTYDTARRCSNKSPPKFVFFLTATQRSLIILLVVLVRTRASNYQDGSSPLDRCSGILCLNITIITKITNNTSQVKSRTLSAQLPFSFPLSPLKRQHVTDCASINILPIHLPGGGESGTRQRAAHAARLSAKGRQLAGAFSTLCAFTRKRRDVESFQFCRFLKKSLFDERLGASFMFRNTSSSHASFSRRWAAAVSTSLPTRLTTCLPARVQL